MKKILLLEDEEALGKIYKLFLEKAGYEIRWMKTAEDTEEEAKRFDAELVLIDHAIKGRKKGGLDIIHSLRVHLPKSKLIVLSNYDKSYLVNEIKEGNVDEYLLKIDNPPSKLVNYINNYLLNK